MKLPTSFYFAAALLRLAMTAGAASFVANPGFELNYNATFPGYSSINNWNGGSGVNQATGPFHNPGTPIPDGTRVGFQQGSGTLSQAISGLTPGRRYWIQLHYDARNCCGGTINISVQWNGAELALIPGVSPSAGGAPYKFRNVPFEATAATGTLAFVTTAAGDATVDYDAVTIVQRDLGNATVMNPGFEAGGDSAVTPIGGWAITGTAGINRSPGGTFANNGATPEQDHVVYVRNQNSSIRQTISGLVPGQLYTVSAAVNARTGNAPVLRISAQGASLSEAAVAPVGGTAAYTVRSASFTASGTTAVIEFTQTAAGDQTVLLDDIKVAGLVQEPLPCLGLAPGRLELAPGVQAPVFVTVPQGLLTFPPAGGVAITIRSPNPLILRIPSGIDDVITIPWTNGDPLTKSFLVEAAAPGSVNLEVLNSATLCVDTVVTATVTTQLVRNPSFELDAVPPGVGYSAITGWDTTAVGNTGLNRAGMPFLDNGAVPDAAQVALIQGANSLSQSIAGLVPGTGYWLQMRYNARTGGVPLGFVRFGGVQIATIPPVTPVGGGNAFYTLTAPFTPSASAGLLEIVNTVTADATLLVDAVTIVPRTAGEIVLQNPSFDASARVAYPGYTGATPIAGWTVTGGIGLNSTGVGPFTDNGDAPDQEMVFFIQNAGSAAQTVEGLPAGSTCTLSYAVNTRSAGWTAPGTPYSVSIGGTTIFSETLAPVAAGSYYQRYVVFTAPAATAELKFTNTTTSGDLTLLLDNIRLIPGNADPGSTEVPLSCSIFAGNALRLAWPASAQAGLRLKWSLNMAPSSWLDVTQPAVIEGADYTIYEPMDDPRRFYKLVRP